MRREGKATVKKQSSKRNGRKKGLKNKSVQSAFKERLRISAQDRRNYGVGDESEGRRQPKQ